MFHDACPGTFKYLEAHYACRSLQQQQQQQQNASGGSKRGPPLPPWLFDAAHGAGNVGANGQTTTASNQRRPWANRDHHRDVAAGNKPSVNAAPNNRLTTPTPAQKLTNDERQSKSNSLSSKDSLKGDDDSSKKEERRKPILVTEKIDSISASPTVLSTTTTSRRVPITTPKPTTTKSSLATTTTTISTASAESTTPKILENDVYRNAEKTTTAKMSILNREEEEDNFGGASSSPVTTFTISSKYEKEEFGKFVWRKKKVSIKKLFSVTWHQRMWKYHFAFTSAKRLKRNEKKQKLFFCISH